MRKELLHRTVIIILLILNFSILSYLYWKEKRQSQKISKPNAVQMLHLDDKQNLLFKEIGNNHGKQMDILRNKQKQCVQNYFKNPSDSLLRCIKNYEAEKIIITDEHFKKMKSVLKQEQLPLYANFKEKAVQYILK